MLVPATTDDAATQFHPPSQVSLIRSRARRATQAVGAMCMSDDMRRARATAAACIRSLRLCRLFFCTLDTPPCLPLTTYRPPNSSNNHRRLGLPFPPCHMLSVGPCWLHCRILTMPSSNFGTPTLSTIFEFCRAVTKHGVSDWLAWQCKFWRATTPLRRRTGIRSHKMMISTLTAPLSKPHQWTSSCSVPALTTHQATEL